MPDGWTSTGVSADSTGAPSGWTSTGISAPKLPTDIAGGQLPPEDAAPGSLESALHTFPKTVAQDIVGTGKSIGNVIAHPIDTATNAYHSFMNDAAERNKYADAAQAAKAKGDYAGMIGNSLASTVPFVGPFVAKTAQAAQSGDWDTVAQNAAHVYTAAAMQKALPEMVPSKQTLANIPAAVSQRVADVPAITAEHILAHPNITKAVTTAATGIPTYMLGHEISPFGSYMAGSAAGYLASKGILNWAKNQKLAELSDTYLKSVPDDVLAASQKNPPLQLIGAVKDAVGKLPDTNPKAVAKDMITDEMTRRQQAAGTPMWPQVAAKPTPPVPVQSPSQQAPVPTGVQYTGTTGATVPVAASGTVGGAPVSAPAPIATPPPAPPVVGPSPQLLKEITQAIGPGGNVQKILDEMAARGAIDPGTGKPVVAPPTTVTPPLAQPSPVSAPTTPKSANVPQAEAERSGNVNLGAFKPGNPGISVEGDPYGVLGRQRNIVSRDANGKPNGYLKFYLNDQLNDVAPPEHGLFPEVYVDPAARRTGVATNLYNAAKDNGFDLSKVSGTELTPQGAALWNARNAAPSLPAYDGLSVPHTFVHTNGTEYPVKLISDEGVGNYAKKNGLTHDAALDELTKNQGYRLDSDNNFRNSLMGKAKDVFGDKTYKQEVYNLAHQLVGTPNIGNIGGEKLLSIYKDLLDRPGAYGKAWQTHIETKYHPEAAAQKVSPVPAIDPNAFNIRTNP